MPHYDWLDFCLVKDNGQKTQTPVAQRQHVGAEDCEAYKEALNAATNEVRKSGRLRGDQI